MNLTGLTFDDVLLRPKRGVLNTREEADITVPPLGLLIPIFSAPMPSVASTQLLVEIIRLGGEGVVHRMNRSVGEILSDWYNAHEMQAVAIGLDPVDFVGLYQAGVRKFVLDVAHAHSDRVLRVVENFKNYGDKDINLVVGNVATYEGTSAVISAGADVVKVGIGPGSVCTTRTVTGFGVPQLEAIQECSRAAAQYGEGVPVIADGGIRNSGDIVKALAAGADAVMIGSLFAHAREAQNDGVHYGCASKRVNDHHAPEGIEKEITGEIEPLKDIVKRLTWAIKSGISYGGATNIKELQENAEWITLTDAGRRESKLT